MNISVNNLSVKYDTHSLFENVSFEVQSGQRFCIDGPSGSGKSSLLRSMLGFVTPQAGTVTIDGQPVNHKTAWSLRHHIAYVTQEPDLGHQQVLDYVRRPFSFKANAHLKWDRQTLHKWLERFNLSETILSKQTTDLSGGEKQRIALIVALLLDRPLLLMDEPASALDKNSKQILKGVLADLQTTIVFISHEDTLTSIADVAFQLHSAGGGNHA